MTNRLYAKGVDHMLTDVNLTSDNLKSVLVDTNDYTPDFDADEFLSDIPAVARVATSANLTVTVTAGVVDVNDHSYASVSGDVSEALIIYKDTGNASTSPLLVYVDTATGLPVTPNGTNVNITIDGGANKLFKWNPVPA